MSALNNLYAALQQKGLEIVEADEKPRQLRIIGRLHKNYGDQWKLVIHRLLTVEVTTIWKADISKKYFLRAGQVFYAWRILFQAENISQFYGDITKTILATPAPTRSMVEEIPLVGASGNRNTRSNVGAVGSVPIGPLAAQRKLAGG